MLRRRSAVSACLGVFGLVWAAAHALAHHTAIQPAAPGPAPVPGPALASYVDYLPTSLALGLALALALAGAGALGKRWTGSPGRSLWLFGIVPVLGFAVDMLVELPAHGTVTLSGTAVVAGELVPALLVGLLVQIPLAFVVGELASRILWLAEDLAWALRPPRRAVPRHPNRPFAWVCSTRASALQPAGSSRSRAPPALFSA